MPCSWISLLVAAVCFMFSNGVNNIALAAWLGPLFLLRYLRTKPAAIGLFIAYCILIATRAFSHRGMIPIPGIYYYIFLLISGVSAVMPYLLDRLVTGRISGYAKTFVFPSALVTIEFLSSHGPTGSWSSTAYSQYGNLPLLQVLAICGLSGITFLIGWFAAVASSIWEEGLTPRAMRWGAVFGMVYLPIILLGEARLGIFPPSPATVRVASLSRPKDGRQLREAVYRDVRENKGTVDEIAEYSAWTKLVDDDLPHRARGQNWGQDCFLGGRECTGAEAR